MLGKELSSDIKMRHQYWLKTKSSTYSLNRLGIQSNLLNVKEKV